MRGGSLNENSSRCMVITEFTDSDTDCHCDCISMYRMSMTITMSMTMSISKFSFRDNWWCSDIWSCDHIRDIVTNSLSVSVVTWELCSVLLCLLLCNDWLVHVIVTHRWALLEFLELITQKEQASSTNMGTVSLLKVYWVLRNPQKVIHSHAHS